MSKQIDESDEIHIQTIRDQVVRAMDQLKSILGKNRESGLGNAPFVNDTKRAISLMNQARISIDSALYANNMEKDCVLMLRSLLAEANTAYRHLDRVSDYALGEDKGRLLSQYLMSGALSDLGRYRSVLKEAIEAYEKDENHGQEDS